MLGEEKMNKKQKGTIVLSIICMIGIFFCSFRLYQILNLPIITLNGNETITMNLYETYNELGAEAYKNKENISDKIKISGNVNNSIPGEYKITYSIKNEKIHRNVIVKDNIAPVIKINGAEELIVGINTEYKDEGATATDNIDGELSNKIEITSNLDMSKLGTYTITYSVKDSANNITTKTRTILVKENSSYVRVSIEKQTVELFKDNKLILTSPIVTGTENISESDKGIFKIYYKSQNVYLKGAGYLSYVNYWMPYNRGEGLHDATWREEFGGKIYKTSGSHGCINMPLEIAEQVYNNVSIGTIVEVY